MSVVKVRPPGPILEPMVAHGSRMSWAGLLRPGDEFCAPIRSRLATMEAIDGTPLRRYFGAWSDRYHRFTVNLSSPRVSVRPLDGEVPEGRAIHCIVHWVHRSDMLRLDRGGVCQGDGWPLELWKSFTSEFENISGQSVGEKLEHFLRSDVREDVVSVAEWRRLLRGRHRPESSDSPFVGRGWIPVPARLATSRGDETCIVSWSASPLRFSSLTEALSSAAGSTAPDVTNQAKYYLECIMAKLHGVTFGPYDDIEDARFEQQALVGELASSYQRFERGKLTDPGFGRLDRFG